MKRILKIGMDVHSTNYTLCAMEPVFGADDRIYATIQVTIIWNIKPEIHSSPRLFRLYCLASRILGLL